MVQTKEENLGLTARSKKGRKTFSPKNSLGEKKKETNKGFEKSKILYLYCKNPRQFVRDCHVRERKEGIFHASTTVEENSKEDAPEEKETRREYYLISSLSVSLITG